MVSRWNRVSFRTEYFGDSIQFVNQIGGNVGGDLLRSEEYPPMVALPFRDDKIMLGVMGGEGRLLVGKPTYRFGADVVLERTPDTPISKLLRKGTRRSVCCWVIQTLVLKLGISRLA